MSPSNYTALLSLVSPLFGLGVNCVVQIAAFRAFKQKSLLLSVAIGFLAGLIFMGAAALGAACSEGWRSDFCFRIVFLASPTYICLAYGYFHFVNLGEASIRLRIFDELSRHPKGLPLETLMVAYNDSSILQFRLKRLVSQGDLIDKNGRYDIGRRRFEVVARLLFALKSIILGKMGNPLQ